MPLRIALAVVFVIGLWGCGNGAQPEEGPVTPSRGASPAAAAKPDAEPDGPSETANAIPLERTTPGEKGLDAQVIVDEPVIPDAEGGAHIGMATDPGELHQQWQRFGLPDVPPVVDMDQRDLLFVGFGESGSCPYVLDGIKVDGDDVTFVVGDEFQRPCTADYNPRTLVVSITAGALPEGFLTVTMPSGGETIISAFGSAEPPAAVPNPVSAPDSDVSLIAAPGQAPLGAGIEVLIDNGTDGSRFVVVPGLTVERWTGRHFEVLGQVETGPETIEIGPGEQTRLTTLDTGDPRFPTGDAGWVRLTAQLEITGGDHGRIDARGNLELKKAETTPVQERLAITAEPPCADGASCPARVIIDGRLYNQSCGAVNPALVATQVYATGEGITAHIIDGVDPKIMLAWEQHCEPPLVGRWHVLTATDALGTPAYNEAWCRANANGVDPAEGFDC